MHPKLQSGLETLLGLAMLAGLAAAAGGVLYHGCIKKTIYTDVAVLNEKTTWARDYETGLDFSFDYVFLDQYDDWIRLKDENINKGDQFRSITIRNNWLLGDSIVEYQKR